LTINAFTSADDYIDSILFSVAHLEFQFCDATL